MPAKRASAGTARWLGVVRPGPLVADLRGSFEGAEPNATRKRCGCLLRSGDIPLHFVCSFCGLGGELCGHYEAPMQKFMAVSGSDVPWCVGFTARHRILSGLRRSMRQFGCTIYRLLAAAVPRSLCEERFCCWAGRRIALRRRGTEPNRRSLQ